MLCWWMILSSGENEEKGIEVLPKERPAHKSIPEYPIHNHTTDLMETSSDDIGFPEDLLDSVKSEYPKVDLSRALIVAVCRVTNRPRVLKFLYDNKGTFYREQICAQLKTSMNSATFDNHIKHLVDFGLVAKISFPKLHRSMTYYELTDREAVGKILEYYKMRCGFRLARTKEKGGFLSLDEYVYLDELKDDADFRSECDLLELTVEEGIEALLSCRYTERETLSYNREEVIKRKQQ